MNRSLSTILENPTEASLKALLAQLRPVKLRCFPNGLALCWDGYSHAYGWRQAVAVFDYGGGRYSSYARTEVLMARDSSWAVDFRWPIPIEACQVQLQTSPQ